MSIVNHVRIEVGDLNFSALFSFLMENLREFIVPFLFHIEIVLGSLNCVTEVYLSIHQFYVEGREISALESRMMASS